MAMHSDIKSTALIEEIEKRPVLYDYSCRERATKTKNWQEVCEAVVPDWPTLDLAERQAKTKEVKKRWRSIRDTCTKGFIAGKFLPFPRDDGKPDRRRAPHYLHMNFFYWVLIKQRENSKGKEKRLESSKSSSPSHKQSEVSGDQIIIRNHSKSPNHDSNLSTDNEDIEQGLICKLENKAVAENKTIDSNKIKDNLTTEHEKPAEGLNSEKLTESTDTMNLAEFKKLVESERASLKLGNDEARPKDNAIKNNTLDFNSITIKSNELVTSEFSSQKACDVSNKQSTLTLEITKKHNDNRKQLQCALREANERIKKRKNLVKPRSTLELNDLLFNSRKKKKLSDCSAAKNLSTDIMETPQQNILLVSENTSDLKKNTVEKLSLEPVLNQITGFRLPSEPKSSVRTHATEPHDIVLHTRNASLKTRNFLRESRIPSHRKGHSTHNPKELTLLSKRNHLQKPKYLSQEPPNSPQEDLQKTPSNIQPDAINTSQTPFQQPNILHEASENILQTNRLQQPRELRRPSLQPVYSPQESCAIQQERNLSPENIPLAQENVSQESTNASQLWNPQNPGNATQTAANFPQEPINSPRLLWNPSQGLENSPHPAGNCPADPTSLPEEAGAPALETKADQDHIDDDRMFVNSLLPLFSKMDDDTRLMCRIQVLKFMRSALKGQIVDGFTESNRDSIRNESWLDAFRRAEDSFEGRGGSRDTMSVVSGESDELMRTRSGKAIVGRKRKASPATVKEEDGPKVVRKRGRPRKRRPEDCEDERRAKEAAEKREREYELRRAEERQIYRARQLADLEATLFLKMYNLRPAGASNSLPPGLNPPCT